MLTLVALAVFAQAGPGPDAYTRYFYPLSPEIRSPRIEVDASAMPEETAWVRAAGTLASEWFPEICKLLSTRGFKPPRVVRLVVKPNIGPPAYTAGNTITIKGTWIRDHPDDFGMVIHELTHVIQAYPDSDKTPGWLVEGIADYGRWWRYEPEARRPRIDPEKSKYTDAYRTTAYFLAWVSQRYDKRLVPMLDDEMRHARDPIPVFKQLTGKEPGDLWTEFVATKP